MNTRSSFSHSIAFRHATTAFAAAALTRVVLKAKKQPLI
jgi:hypothetical protein